MVTHLYGFIPLCYSSFTFEATVAMLLVQLLVHATVICYVLVKNLVSHFAVATFFNKQFVVLHYIYVFGGKHSLFLQNVTRCCERIYKPHEQVFVVLCHKSGYVLRR